MKPDATRTNPELADELLKLLSRQLTHAPATAVICMGIIAYMAYQQAPELYLAWGGWLAAVIVAQLARVVIIRNLSGRKHLDPAGTLRAATLVNLCHTLLHSVSLVFFPLFTPFQAALQSMLFIGLGVASIATAMAYMPFALAHLGLVLLPLFGMWTWSGVAGPAGPMGLLIAAIGAVYMVALYTISRRIFAMFEEGFTNRRRLETALARAEAAGNAKTRFLAAASHDLRQPIHSLSLFTAALGMRDLDSQARHIANNIDAAVKALTYQLDALLDMSKLDAGIVPVTPERFSLSAFLRRLDEEFRQPAADKGIAISRQCPDQAVVNTDPALLERIVRNLLTNAIAHNSDCRILLDAARRDDRWLLTIADTGSGIPEEQQSKVFEEFYQVDNPERDRSRGLGLGLAIVQRLTQLLDLDLGFESSPGWGTRFSLHIVADEFPQVTEPTHAPSALAALKILVVDDEASIREGMTVLLEVLGCAVQTAGSSEAALALAGRDRPDLALVDFRLRGAESGLDIIEQLRRIYPQLPAIIISGDTAPDRLRQAREAGIPLLSKPVLVEDLKLAIGEACGIDGAVEAATDRLPGA